MVDRPVHVLLPLPFSRGFDYLSPEGVTLAPGDYVRVPFGKKELVGVVWEGAPEQALERAKLKPVTARVDAAPMSEPTRRFLEWVARYTLSELGSVLKMALPVPEAFTPPKRKGNERAGEPPAAPTPPRLSPAQAEAAAALSRKLGQGYSATLFEGVTGSGKTEVYFDMVAQALETNAEGKQILVLLPEISLSVQWLARFRTRFGFAPRVWHSEVTRAEKKAITRDLLVGKPMVVVGARSALFLPFTNLSLIVVDEEHDASFKQEDGVLYHARDMAVARAHAESIPIVLVSATPSLETLVNIERGRYHHLHLPERHRSARLPEVRLVDMRGQALDADRFLSSDLQKALAETLALKKQSLLFLNRRGFAPLVLCRACGHRFQCPNCTAWLVAHFQKKKTREGVKAEGVQGVAAASSAAYTPVREETSRGRNVAGTRLHAFRFQCHHCDYREPAPSLCPECGAEDSLHPCGPGVERVAQEVAERFPSARVAILSSDEGADVAERLRAVERGDIDIVVGTQMLAKGHHFPGLALVGIVDADLGLAGGDLRAGERSFQLLQQIAGRAGREKEVEGTVLVQTFFPDHPVLAALANHDREAFVALEKAQRRQSGMPPFGRLAALIVDGSNEQEVRRFSGAMAALAPRMEGVDILGPAPAPLSLLRGRYRYRFLVRTGPNIKIQDVIAGWLATLAPTRAVRVRADIDPQSFY